MQVVHGVAFVPNCYPKTANSQGPVLALNGHLAKLNSPETARLRSVGF